MRKTTNAHAAAFLALLPVFASTSLARDGRGIEGEGRMRIEGPSANPHGSDTNPGNARSATVRLAQDGGAGARVNFNIHAPKLARALIQLSEQVGLQLIYPAGDKVIDLPAKPLLGSYSTQAALDELLKDSGLKYEFLDSHTISIVDYNAKAVATKTSPARGGNASYVRLAQNTGAPDTGNTGEAQNTGTEGPQDKQSAQGTESGSGKNQDSQKLQEISVIGTRRSVRSPSDTPSPVDIIAADQVSNQASANLLDTLNIVVPSLNTSAEPVGGSGSAVRPMHLRGLSPDATLILVNGKRRHRASVVVSGGSTDALVVGSQPPDISTIPAIALSRIEVLRDGASAQYGADATAGVINFVMREDIGGLFETQMGQYYDTDNDATVHAKDYSGNGVISRVAGTYGMRLGQEGHFNISAEYGNAGGISRSVQQASAAAQVAAGNTAIDDPVQIWGTPEISDELKLFANLAVETGLGSQLYAFGGYSQHRIDTTFFWRNPNGRTATYVTAGTGANDGELVRLVGDLTPADGVNCAGGIDFTPGPNFGVRDEIVVGTPQDAAAIAAAAADPNCFVFNELFPGGFTPFFGIDVNDTFGTTGLRGAWRNGVTYDLSIGAGRNETNFDIVDSVNASLGPRTPLFFKAGSNVELEKTINADFTYPLEVGLASPLNVAAGFEWREETFQLGVGQPEGIQAGVLGNTSLSLGVHQGFEARLNGFAPTRPEVAGEFARHNNAVYLDLEADMTRKLVLGAAVRLEDFSDFGSQTTYKLSGLYHLTDALSLRSTYSTNFRAPTIGQQNYSAITTFFGPSGTLISTGTVPSTSAPALLRGGRPLQPETAKGFTVGLGWESNLLRLTLDYFHIEMEDRITLSQNFTLTPPESAALDASGFPSTGLASFRFFTNDFSSTTQGLDAVLSMPLRLPTGGSTTLTAVANWTDTEVTSFDPNDPTEALGPLEVLGLEDSLPAYRGNATIAHEQGRWGGFVRVNYFGGFKEAHLGDLDHVIDGKPRATVDAELSFDVRDSVELVVGAQDIFDGYPTHNPYAADTGSRWTTISQQGFNGGFYYGRLRVKF